MDDWQMSLSGKLLGAAAVGGIASYLMQGDATRRAKARAVASAAFGWAFGVVAFHLFPDLTNAPDEAKMGIVCICCGFAGYLFDRIQRMSFSAKIGGVEIESDGDEHK